MQKLLLIVAGVSLFGALFKKEAQEDGVGIALSPFIAALAIEAGIFILRRHQNTLLSDGA